MCSQHMEEEGVRPSFVETVWVSVVTSRQQQVFFLCPMKGPPHLRPGPSLQSTLHSPWGPLRSSVFDLVENLQSRFVGKEGENPHPSYLANAGQSSYVHSPDIIVSFSFGLH